MNINSLFDDSNSSYEDSLLKVVFDNIELEVCKEIEKHNLIVGCTLTLSNEKIIEALSSNEKEVCIIVDKKSSLKKQRFLKDSSSNLTAFKFDPSTFGDLYLLTSPDVKQINNKDPIRLFGLSTEPYEEVGDDNETRKRYPLSHQKFLVFCNYDNDGTISAEKIVTGSFNFSDNAPYSRENVIFINDPKVANLFYREWQRIATLSEPLNQFCKDDIAPQFLESSMSGEEIKWNYETLKSLSEHNEHTYKMLEDADAAKHLYEKDYY
ncbi:phospholipase D-like domain-containing protein [Thalassotalea sp. G2M2-11]|uniref:phospholipase D-like domain-containing protein n=1 Tax=Thalassotalea sp. G2M2-11 TaxID=2787627 RepID=UPI0019D1F077|nr:phospholipase D-like domain-containing protein [Thalassotalea sp. G2M2-11]